MTDLSDATLRAMANNVINGLTMCKAGDFRIPAKVINYLIDEIINALRTIREAQRFEEAERWSQAMGHAVHCAVVGRTPTCSCGAHDKQRILHAEHAAAIRATGGTDG